MFVIIAVLISTALIASSMYLDFHAVQTRAKLKNGIHLYQYSLITAFIINVSQIRVIRDGQDDYKVEFRVSWSPFWTDIGNVIYRSEQKATARVRQIQEEIYSWRAKLEDQHNVIEVYNLTTKQPTTPGDIYD